MQELLETRGCFLDIVIQKNTTIPTKSSQVFSTADDNQTAVTVHVLQGERERASDNKSLERFDLTGIPPASRGTPQIEVSFDIDANGILHVSAKDKATGKEQSISIKASSGLSEDEIKRMVDDAEAHAEEDREFRNKIMLKNNIESLGNHIRQQKDEHLDKLSDEEKVQIETYLTELENIKTDDSKEVMEEFLQKSDEIGQIFAKFNPAPTGAGTPDSDMSMEDILKAATQAQKV